MVPIHPRCLARRSLSEGGYIAKFPLTIPEFDSKKFEGLLAALDDQEDVQEVYSNADLPTVGH